jgi:hypothetical protein
MEWRRPGRAHRIWEEQRKRTSCRKRKNFALMFFKLVDQGLKNWYGLSKIARHWYDRLL